MKLPNTAFSELHTKFVKNDDPLFYDALDPEGV
jgi:hypothetical protein